MPEILDSTVTFRIGGNFGYPPLTLNRDQCQSIERAVFIAGGVGINPIMSMISAMNELGTNSKIGGMVKTVRLLYSAKRERDQQGNAEEILFEKRLKDIAEEWRDVKDVDYQYTLFETGGRQTQEEKTAGNITTRFRRINHNDLFEAIGPEETRDRTVVYVCGLPAMTDEFVDLLRKTPGLDEKRVLCEKWW